MFIPLIDKPTRVTNTSKNILDHVWSNMDVQFTSYILETNFTDHFTVISSFYLNSPSPFIIKKFRNHSDYAITNFCNVFNSYVANEYHSEELPFDETVELVISKINRIYNECCPILSKNLSNNRTTKPWLNGKIIKLIRFKHYLYSEYKKNYIPFGVYDGFRNGLTHAIDNVKRNFIRNTFISCRNNSKKTWMNINKYVKSSNKKRFSITLVEGGVVQTDDKKNAESFKNYFSSVAPNLDNAIPHPINCSFSDYLESPLTNVFSVNPSQPSEVKKLILDFKNKNCPINEIPSYIYKKSLNLFLILYHIGSTNQRP